MDFESIKTSVQQQFDAVAHHYLQDSPMAEAGLLDLIFHAAAPRRDGISLDIACGAGLLVCRFAPFVSRAVGVDLSRGMLTAATEEALRRGLANTVFDLADSESLPFLDNSFHIVTCKLAFHYFPNPARALAEMKRVAEREGRIVLVDRVAAEDPQARELHNRIEKLRTPSKVKVYAPSEISSLLEEEGLTVRAVHSYEQYQDMNEWLITTGASGENLEQARRLMLESREGDRAGLKLFTAKDKLMMTHSTRVFVAEK